MKKNDWLIVISTAAYTFLFYDQSAGLNVLIFSVLLVALTIYRDKGLIKHRQWILSAAGTLMSGFAVFYYGNGISILANIFSIVLFAAFSFDAQRSLFIALIFSVYSFLLALPAALIRSFASDASRQNRLDVKTKRGLLFMIPLLVTLVFFFLYRESNPLFAKVTDQINFSFISISWLLFTFSGLFLMHAFFSQRSIQFLTDEDSRIPNVLNPITEEEHHQSVFGTIISLQTEIFIGLSLFMLLNLLLLSVNAIDLYYVYVVKYLPYNLTISEYVHDGTNALIVSIILAIGIILFYFRGYLNFSAESKRFRWLTYAWVIQNMIAVLTTANRNWIYISNYGLTHKRVGVYVFLGLCLFGLLTSFIKVAGVKSNWFLFRRNTWAWYIVLVIALLVNWDSIIANYNIGLAKSKNQSPDENYLADLGYTALPAMVQYYVNEKGTSKHFSDYLAEQMKVQYYNLERDVNCPWQSIVLSKREAKQHIDALPDSKKLFSSDAGK